MRQGREVQSSQHKLRIEPFAFTANNTSAPAETSFEGAIEGVTRTGTGTFEVEIKQAYPTVYGGFPTVTSTAGTKVVVKSIDMDTKIVTVETRRASATAAVTPAWTTAAAVTDDVLALTAAGLILAVDVTAGDTTGPMTILSTGTPATGQVLVEYAAGVPTLTFAADDAVTETSYLTAPVGPNAAWEAVVVASHTVTLTGRKGYVVGVESTAGTDAKYDQIISTGTPGDGQVKVTYSSGVPTLTFNTADAITAANVLFIPMDLVSEPLVDTTETVAFALLCSASAHQIR